MSKEDKTKKRLSNNLPTRANYRIGYGKPPKESRFQPGQSGNPRGRPRGAKNKRPALNEDCLLEFRQLLVFFNASLALLLEV